MRSCRVPCLTIYLRSKLQPSLVRSLEPLLRGLYKFIAGHQAVQPS